jgi:hypothetical protein
MNDRTSLNIHEFPHPSSKWHLSKPSVFIDWKLHRCHALIVIWSGIDEVDTPYRVAELGSKKKNSQTPSN